MSEKILDLFIEKIKAVLSMSLANEFNIIADQEITELSQETIEHDEYVIYQNNFINSENCYISVLLNKEYTAKLADLMVMGDGTAAFSEDEHLDAIKELFDQVIGSFTTDILSQFKIELNSEGSSSAVLKASELDNSDSKYYQINFVDDKQKAIIIISDGYFNLFAEESPEKEQKKETTGIQTILENPNIKKLLDTDIEIEIFYGNTRRKIEDILLFNNNTILELNDLKDEAVDIYVNGHMFAKGKIVVIDKNYSVEIKKIVSVKERILSLKH